MGYRSVMKTGWPTLAIASASIWACAAPATPPVDASLDSGAPGVTATIPLPACQRDASGIHHPTLQAALDAAEPGSVVQACDRTEGHRGPLILRQDVTLVGPALIQGGPGPAVHVVSGHARIRDMTLDGGLGAIEPRLDGDTFGGVVAAWEADSLELQDTTVRAGAADWGGCIAGPRTGPLVLRRVTLSACTARKLGGAIWIRSGTIEDSVVETSHAPYGGGVAVRSVSPADGGVYLTGTVIQANHADVQGGGLLITGPAMVTGGTVQGNTSEQGAGVLLSEATGGWRDGLASTNVAAVGGGGMFITGGTPSLHQISLVRNTASGDALPDGRGVGGGLWVAGDATTAVLLDDVTLDGNQAAWGGGLMVAGAADWPSGPTVSIERGVLRDHTATDGGAAAVVGARLSLEQTDVTDNTGTSGGGVLLATGRLDARGGRWSGNDAVDIETEAGTFGGPGDTRLSCDASGCTEEPDPAR